MRIRRRRFRLAIVRNAFFAILRKASRLAIVRNAFLDCFQPSRVSPESLSNARVLYGFAGERRKKNGSTNGRARKSLTPPEVRSRTTELDRDPRFAPNSFSNRDYTAFLFRLIAHVHQEQSLAAGDHSFQRH